MSEQIGTFLGFPVVLDSGIGSNLDLSGLVLSSTFTNEHGVTFDLRTGKASIRLDNEQSEQLDGPRL